MNSSPLLIAHRGFSAEAPENTLASFRLALEEKPAYIEFDVQSSKDGVPMIFHDETVERTTNHKTPLAFSSLKQDELQKLDAGAWFSERFKEEKIPTLVDVLNLPLDKTGLMIELKETPDQPDNFPEKVLQTLKSHPIKTGQNPYIIGSFSSKLLDAVHALSPHQPLIGIAETTEQLEDWIARKYKLVALHQSLITKDLIELLKKKKMVVWAFTVDSQDLAMQLRDFGVKGLITNHPRSLKKVLL